MKTKKTNKTMKRIGSKMAVIIFALMATTTFAQTNSGGPNTFQREGFIFEFGLGGGLIAIEDSRGMQTFNESQGGISFPELKLGYMLKDDLALTAAMPGMIYKFNGRDRHFGGFIPSLQYWVKDRWWIHGGLGLAIDSPALYDIEDDLNDDWNFGGVVMASTGYEIYKKKKFALNIQSKVVMGRAFLKEDAHRDAVTFNIGLGFNWL